MGGNEKNILTPNNGSRTNKENPNWDYLEWKSLGTLTGNIEGSLTNRIQHIEERVSAIEDILEEMAT